MRRKQTMNAKAKCPNFAHSVSSLAVWLAMSMCCASMASAQDVAPPGVTVIPLESAASLPAAQARTVTPNSVAVLELGVRREHRDFFYDEKLDRKTTFKGSNQVGVDGRPPAANSGADSDSGMPSNSQMLRQANVTNTASGDGSIRIASSTTVESQSDLSYSKQFGFKKSVSYTELRGLMVDLRGALSSAGYAVRFVNPSNTKQMEQSPALTFQERLLTGEFGDAEFVLIPNIVNVGRRLTKEPIQGSKDYSNRLELNLVAEFSMVDTKDMKVVAAFNAYGNGTDMYIGRDSATFVPDTARISRDLVSSFGEDAKRKLLAQLPKPQEKTFFGTKDNPANSFEGDPKTLKVYRSTETSEKSNSDGSKESTKKEAIQIFKQ
jgi:hypothetical protein